MPYAENPFLSRGLASTTLHPLGLEVDRAEGPWLILKNGTRLFDAISGIGVSNFGHGHPGIQAELQRQLDRHLHAMVYGEFLQEAQTRASALLRASLPESLDGVYFLNSGAEAIDAALKLAKRVTGRRRLFAVTGGYHGNTHGALSVSSNELRKAPFRPLLPEVEFVTWNDLADLKRVDETVACVVAETVQGDAGIRIPDRAWLQALRDRCTKSGVLLVLDEIQCGMGRTGKPWAFEHFGVTPDVLCMGKALGGGMPIGALAASTDLLGQFAHHPSLGHITTFGGHPMACAGAVGALTALHELDFSELERHCSVWHKALEEHPAVERVRRIGAFFAVELESAEAVQKAVDVGLASQDELGVLLFWFLSVPNAFRLAPPLVATEQEMAQGLALILSALDDITDLPRQ
ncbi:MAG: aspartate aminotransferase family protein [Bacteroidetes bacterium]|nr:aspartate aminotransferase family protein [Bacteroidota bacterium]